MFPLNPSFESFLPLSAFFLLFKNVGSCQLVVYYTHETFPFDSFFCSCSSFLYEFWKAKKCYARKWLCVFEDTKGLLLYRLHSATAKTTVAIRGAWTRGPKDLPTFGFEKVIFSVFAWSSDGLGSRTPKVCITSSQPSAYGVRLARRCSCFSIIPKDSAIFNLAGLLVGCYDEGYPFSTYSTMLVSFHAASLYERLRRKKPLDVVLQQMKSW